MINSWEYCLIKLTFTLKVETRRTYSKDEAKWTNENIRYSAFSSKFSFKRL